MRLARSQHEHQNSDAWTRLGSPETATLLQPEGCTCHARLPPNHSSYVSACLAGADVATASAATGCCRLGLLGRGYALIADRLLSKLDKVKRIGVDRWLACCPAHDDKHPSLSIREADGERVLVKCWSGCSTEDVLRAAGLEFDALYPSRPTHRGKPERRPFPAADVLRAVEHEALIAAVAALSRANGVELTDEDRARLLVASTRITSAVKESRHA